MVFWVFFIENAEYHSAVFGKSKVDEIFYNGNAGPVLQSAFSHFFGMKSELHPPSRIEKNY